MKIYDKLEPQTDGSMLQTASWVCSGDPGITATMSRNIRATGDEIHITVAGPCRWDILRSALERTLAAEVQAISARGPCSIHRLYGCAHDVLKGGDQ